VEWIKKKLMIEVPMFNYFPPLGCSKSTILYLERVAMYIFTAY